MARRIFGVFLILIGFFGILLAVQGAQLTKQAVADLGSGMESSVDLVLDSLDTVLDSLLLTRDALAEVEGLITQVEETAVNVSDGLDSTDPILTEMQLITTQDLPDSLEAIEAAVPDAVQAADAIDSTLVTLNRFEIDTSILGFPIQYDLGIDYDPTVPFSASVEEIGRSLEGMPARLRGLEAAFSDTQTNLTAISGDMDSLAADLVIINEQIAGFTPLVNDFIRVVTEGTDTLRVVKGQIADQVALINTIITLGMVWLVLSQVVPLYLGYELIMGRLSPGDEPVLTVENANQEAVSDDGDV